MSGGEILLAVMFASLVGVLLSGVPVYAALCGVPFAAALAGIALGLFDGTLLGALPQRLFGILANGVFPAIPLFILMGVVLERSGMAARMLAGLQSVFGQSRRGLAFSVLAAGTLIAASTGMVGATVIMLAMIAYPALERAGVPRDHAPGLVIAAGSLGQIIPPSIVLILLADQVSFAFQAARREAGDFAAEPVSVAELFGAALLPGLLLAVLYALFAAWRLGGNGVQQGEGPSPSPDLAGTTPATRLAVLAPVLLILLVLGAILAGFATPTEAAAIGACGVLVMAYISGSRGSVMIEAMRETVFLSGAVFAIVIGASILALVFRGLGGDELFAEFAANLPGGANTALLGVLLIVFALGFVLEFIEITFIVVPVAGPVLFALGVDPVWFAILMAINLQTSFLTPPFGVAIFYFRSVAPPSLPNGMIYRSVIPFVAMQLVVMGLVFAFPGIALTLPEMLGR